MVTARLLISAISGARSSDGASAGVADLGMLPPRAHAARRWPHVSVIGWSSGTSARCCSWSLIGNGTPGRLGAGSRMYSSSESIGQCAILVSIASRRLSALMHILLRDGVVPHAPPRPVLRALRNSTPRRLLPRAPRAPVEGADRARELGPRETFGEVPGVTPFVNERQQRGVRLLVSQPRPHRAHDRGVVGLPSVLIRSPTPRLDISSQSTVPAPHRDGAERGEEGVGGHDVVPSGRISWRSRLTAISQYFGSISMPMAAKSSDFAASRVVPLPQYGSTTGAEPSLY